MKHGWEYKKLGEVTTYPNKRISLTEISAQEYVGVETLVKDKGGVCFSNEKPNADSAIEFFENDILIGNIRPYLKKIWISDRHGGASGDVINIRIADNFKNHLDSSFLYCILSSDTFFDYDNANTHGAKMPRGDKKAISEYLIPLPSLTVQHSIVAELNKINELIRLKKEQLGDYDKLAQSLFYEMFGDPIENEKGWEMKKLGEIANPTIGLTYKPENVVEDGTIVLRSGNIQDSEIELEDIVRVNAKIPENKIVKSGDILMCSRNGSFRLVGKVAMIKETPEAMSYGAFMTIIRSNYNPYLFGFFKTPAFREYLIQGKTTTVNQITVKMLQDILLPLPPIALQQVFAQRIELIEQQKAEIKNTIADLETLLASRMQYWFD